MHAAVKYQVHLRAGLPLTVVRSPQPELSEEEKATLRVEFVAGLPAWQSEAA